MTQWNPWFVADWERAVFIHFRVDPTKLAAVLESWSERCDLTAKLHGFGSSGTSKRSSPAGLELDTWNGDAIVSLVAFTQSRLRPAIGGRISEWLSTPLACHEFLNLRTYVRRGNERGIFFLSEWIPNRLAALLGPAMYGLPYRVGQLRYRYDPMAGTVSGQVTARNRKFGFRGCLNPPKPLRIADPGSLDHFLVERYAAYTLAAGIVRRFRIDHAPWKLAEVQTDLLQITLLDEFAPVLGETKLLCAHFSPGVRNVLIGAPEKLISRHVSGKIEGRPLSVVSGPL